MGRSGKLIGAALAAMTGAGVLAVAGPVGGHAWGKTSACVISKGRIVTTPNPPTDGSLVCATVTFGPGQKPVAVAVTKPGITSEATAVGNGTGVTVLGGDATGNGGVGLAVKCPGTSVPINETCVNGSTIP